MKVNSIFLGMFLLAIFGFDARADSLRPQASGMNVAGIPVPTLKLNDAKSRADGSFEFQVDSTEQFKVLIESSGDLTNWNFEALREPRTAVVFTNTNARGVYRFYRASDYTLSIEGTVRDIQTDAPLALAQVTISDLFWQTKDIVTQTDAQGLFRAVLSREYPLRNITVEKAGYDVLTTEPYADQANPNFQVHLWLAPPGYRPPNDDFRNRQVLEGTNVVVRTRTFAATSEAGHALNVSFDDYDQSYNRNLWWTWTVPTNGAVLIERDEAPVRGGSGMVVYIGQSLEELVRVWDTSNFENAFFVKQGVQYQIGFGTVWPAETGFTLRMVAPVPPFGVSAWVGHDVISSSPITAVGEGFYLSVWADGTSPLSYQWRKDGLDIPNATNTFFARKDLGLEDAGAYSVLVTNEAGTAISDEIQITVLLDDDSGKFVRAPQP